MKKVIFILLFSTLFISGCGEETSSNYNIESFEEYPLEGVIDGDTIRINYHGSTEKVRLLLLDTPETNHETLGEQPFGQEAKAYTKKLLEGQETVYLEFDVSYRDKYKRLLAYVYTADGKSIQEELLKKGLARVAYVYEPNTKHVDRFESIQKEAQQQGIGIWSVENYATDRGFDKSVFGENGRPNNKGTSNTSKSSCAIKGNINSKGVKIYHSPGQKDYDSTQPEEMFCSAEEAESAGYKAASR